MRYMTSIGPTEHISRCMYFSNNVRIFSYTNNVRVLSSHFELYLQLIPGYDSPSPGFYRRY